MCPIFLLQKLCFPFCNFWSKDRVISCRFTRSDETEKKEEKREINKSSGALLWSKSRLAAAHTLGNIGKHSQSRELQTLESRLSRHLLHEWPSGCQSLQDPAHDTVRTSHEGKPIYPLLIRKQNLFDSSFSYFRTPFILFKIPLILFEKVTRKEMKSWWPSRHG